MPQALDLSKRLHQPAFIDRHVTFIAKQSGPLLIAIEKANRLIPLGWREFIWALLVGEEIAVEDQRDWRPMRDDFQMAEVAISHDASIVGAGTKRSVVDEVRNRQ